ncbi:hypothetical protein HLI18_31365 [Rhizobium laguerreae]|uniref:hypothetical protein n=1 Tax=Rhizobium laguerreae TaxID=1076926 RepID=UPI00147871DF|nr:hypothetical protein [Rhizobium laguerreae]NNG74285.1 hypothetical protein [Rhizobium laguerreae]
MTKIQTDMLPHALEQIAARHKFFSPGQAIDSLIGPSLHQHRSEFQFRAVEDLLREAAVLLDRSAAERQVKQELEEKLLFFWLDQYKNEEILRSKDEQIAAGEHSIAGRIAEHEELMHRAAAVISELQVSKNNEAAEQRKPEDQHYQRRVDLNSRVTSLSAHQNTGAVQAASADLTRLQMEQELLSAEASVYAAGIGREIHQSNETISRIRKDFSFSNAVQLDRQHDAEKKYSSDRRILAETPGSALNYIERLEEVQRLFEEDIVAAYKRCVAAQRGLEAVFGIRIPLPNVDERPITELVLWLRRAVEVMSELTDREQSLYYSFAATQILEGDELQALRDGRRARFSINREDLLENRLIRVIGVAAEVSTDRIDEEWPIQFHLPSVAAVIYNDGSSAAISQDDIGIIYVSSCPNPSAKIRRDCENGSRTFRNACPLGQWSLQIGRSNLGRSPSAISDVFVHLKLNMVT